MTTHDGLSAILKAAIDSVNPYRSVKNALQSCLPEILTAKNIYVVGCGKAVVPMALAVEDSLQETDRQGLVVTKYGHLANRKPECIEIREANHPVPDVAGVEASKDILTLLRKADKDDVVIALVSGGGSALWVQPPPEISFEDKMRVSELLLQSGASIGEINTIRKHLSLIKGGHAATQAFPAKVFAFIISDVVGDYLDVIASGPFVADSSTFQQANEIIAAYDLEKRMPQTVLRYIEKGVVGIIQDTPKAGDDVFRNVDNQICSSNAIAVEAAKKTAQSLGFHVVSWDGPLVGEASLAAHSFVEKLLSLQDQCPVCLVAGGETTVTLGKAKGKGGRNQEFALSAARYCQGHPVLVASLGTDGNDGPTDAAGGYIDGNTLELIRKKGYDIEKELKNHNAYPVLQSLNQLIMTGPTNTNVADIQIGLYL
jgi:glycerate 2-kinase